MISEFKRNPNRVENDFYATDTNEVVNILKYEKLNGSILEPCCGIGHMVRGLEQSGYKNVIATDLIDRGFGEGNLDFLDENYPYKNVDNIIMNPPYSLLSEFIQKSLKIVNKKLICHCRMQCLEGEKRYNDIFKYNPPNRVYVYVDRVGGLPNGIEDKKVTKAMIMSWIVWNKEDTSRITKLEWIRRFDKQENQNGK